MCLLLEGFGGTVLRSDIVDLASYVQVCVQFSAVVEWAYLKQMWITSTAHSLDAKVVET